MLKTLTVKEYMATNVIALSVEMGIVEAVQILLKNRISGAPVVGKNSELQGMLSEKDCLKVVLETAYHESMGGKVGEYMSAEVKTIPAHMGIIEVAGLFIDSPYRRFPVVNGSKLVGQISRRDVLKALESTW